MTMIQIFRVENDEGEGMYSADMSSELFELQGRHPTPTDDSALMKAGWGNAPQSSFNFGFKDLSQLKNWLYMDDWKQSLNDEGFFISVYDVDHMDTLLGDTQAVFLKPMASKSHQLSLLEI